MAASEVQIANLALQMLGAPSIISLTEDTLSAREMNLAFASVRDAELNRRRWRFSIVRTSLPALASTPDSDYAYQYQLPGNFIRLIEGGDIRAVVDLSDYRGSNGAALYQIEGRRLLTNLPAPLAIRYIARITDTGLFTPAFDMAFAASLALQTCEKITQATQKQAACDVLYRKAIREAASANALELASEPQGDDTWVMARTS
jgi:hypothetical protein